MRAAGLSASRLKVTATSLSTEGGLGPDTPTARRGPSFPLRALWDTCVFVFQKLQCSQEGERL